MALSTKLDQMLAEYRRDHQNPVNKAFHMVGIPIILLSIPLLLIAPQIGVALFVFGWILQFIGHAFEGKAPTFFRDPSFLLVGATWYLKRFAALVSGKPVSA